MKKVVFAISIIALLTGCVPTTVTEYVVMRDVPMNPSITVIPYNFYYEQVNFSHEIEEALLENGVRTLHFNMATKQITKQKGAGLQEEGVISGIGANVSNLLKSGKAVTEEITIESYLEYADIKAPYLIHSNMLNGRVRIVHKDSLEVLASHELSSAFMMGSRERQYYLRKALHDMLEALGFQVRDLPPPPEPTAKPTPATDDSF